MNDDEIFDYVEKLLNQPVRTTNKTDSLTNLSAPLYLSHAKQQAKLPELRALLEMRRNQLLQGPEEAEETEAPATRSDDFSSSSPSRKHDRTESSDTEDESEDEESPFKQTRTLNFESSELSDYPLLEGTSSSSSSQLLNVSPEYTREEQSKATLSDDFGSSIINRKRDRIESSDTEDESEDEESALKQIRTSSFEPSELSDCPLLESTSSSSSSQLLNVSPECTREEKIRAIDRNIQDGYNIRLPNKVRLKLFSNALYALDDMKDDQDKILRARALIGLGNIKYSSSYRTIDSWYREALDILPKSNYFAALRARAFIGLGDERYSDSKNKVTDWYDEALRILPLSKNFISLRARALIGLGNVRHITPFRSWGSWYQEAYDLVENVRGLEVLRDRAYHGVMKAQRSAESRR